MAQGDGSPGAFGFSGRGFLRGPEHEVGVARGNGSLDSVLIPLGHFALILVALFIVADAAGRAGESKGVSASAVDQAKVAIARADLAEREARIAQSKIESLRNEVSELHGMVIGKPKEK